MLSRFIVLSFRWRRKHGRGKEILILVWSVVFFHPDHCSVDQRGSSKLDGGWLGRRTLGGGEIAEGSGGWAVGFGGRRGGTDVNWYESVHANEGIGRQSMLGEGDWFTVLLWIGVGQRI